MPKPTIHGKPRAFSASAVLEAVGGDIALIKDQDTLTWADIGAVLGKSEDQAAKYASAEADMGLVSYARGKREWNGRFTGSLERLCVESRPAAVAGRTIESCVLKAALALSIALEDDNEIDAREVRAVRAETQLQRTIRQYLTARGYQTVHVPNGATLRGDAEQRKRQMFNLKRDGLMPGFPDLIVYGKGGKVGHIEVKCEGSYQQATQKDVQKWMTDWGHRYSVCRSLQDVTETLESWGWA